MYYPRAAVGRCDCRESSTVLFALVNCRYGVFSLHSGHQKPIGTPPLLRIVKVSLAFACLACGWAQADDWRVDGAERIVAIADVHGAFEAMVDQLAPLRRRACVLEQRSLDDKNFFCPQQLQYPLALCRQEVSLLSLGTKTTKEVAH